MKIAYVYEYDASNPAIQSTRPYSIRRELKKNFQVIDCFPIPNISRRILAPKKLWYSLKGLEHHLEREWLTLKEYAGRVGRILAREKVDIVFSPSQLIPTYLRTSAKIIYCNDAPFGAIANYYNNFSNLSPAYMRQGYSQEWAAHQNADRIVYPSAWAVDCAVRLHGASREKCRQQAFGANLPYDPPWKMVDTSIDDKINRTNLALLLISSDWERKGGPFAVDVVRTLRSKGIDAILRVIGDAPKDMDGVESLGRIDKWTEEGSKRFSAAMFNSNFIIMPSVAEAYGMSLWEGAAHGLPMIGRATGGITSIIDDRKNGLLFPKDGTAELVADWIEDAMAAPTYRRLSESAFNDYHLIGNWKTFVSKVFDL